MSKIPELMNAVDPIPPGEYVIERREHLGKGNFRCVITEGPFAGRELYILDPALARVLEIRVNLGYVQVSPHNLKYVVTPL